MLNLEINPPKKTKRSIENPDETVRTNVLTISGDFYERKSTTNLFIEVTSGQIGDKINPYRFHDSSDLREILKIWNQWHLNDLKAGTRRQAEILSTRLADKDYSYDKAVSILKDNDLYVDRGYVYGSAWLAEELPHRWHHSNCGAMPARLQPGYC